ncbi:outer membrane assembly lipoprotein YfiO [Anaerohalosphaera lusitana]|uniref:Outer membrane assembly lipoprotein YfiO n=1 Tax=Anaerohalosphaera lusitana TaxID=1936003 RepID=A0A1U9NI90_9BACT|nr:tetratricopeptide repeat protein [Anaerohalosphaera lusitana]AQT67643.1 outer membrane assembly lipoprotein YfiO [Anaerohalosphaera lusitana]
MTKTIYSLTLILLVVMAAGCGEQVQKELYEEPSGRVVQEGISFAAPTAEEVELVEYMAAQRSSYRKSLQALADYYKRTGDATKLRWARQEVDALNEVPRYSYIMAAETVDIGQRAVNEIEAANQLYNEGLSIYRSTAFVPVLADEGKLRQALAKFNAVISRYPTSDKVDDAAYRAGRIYEHFDNYEIAVTYYKRAFKWDPNTPYPVRYRAAFLLDHRLHDRKEALTLYRDAVEKESSYFDNMEYARNRILQLTQPEREVSPEVEETEPVEGQVTQ